MYSVNQIRKTKNIVNKQAIAKLVRKMSGKFEIKLCQFAGQLMKDLHGRECNLND
jgi:hypothetical protein